jgi:hypothetical protein
VLERHRWNRMKKEKGGGEGGEYKKGSKERGRPPFRRAWARGMKACGPARAPQDDITPPSSSLLFFPFISIPLSAPDWPLGSPWSMHVL